MNSLFKRTLLKDSVARDCHVGAPRNFARPRPKAGRRLQVAKAEHGISSGGDPTPKSHPHPFGPSHTVAALLSTWDGTMDASLSVLDSDKYITGGSHTRMTFPVAELECYGCYAVTGPAIIRKNGDLLEASLGEDAQLSFFDRDTVVAIPQQSIAEGDGAGYSCCLLFGEHVEVSGDYEVSTTKGKHYHDGKLVLSVHSMDDNGTIVLNAGGRLSHPVNVQPCKPCK